MSKQIGEVMKFEAVYYDESCGLSTVHRSIIEAKNRDEALKIAKEATKYSGPGFWLAELNEVK